MPPGALNLLVFREDRRRVSGAELKSALRQELERLTLSSSRDQLISALLRAGELECGVSDSGAGPVRPYACLTDSLADALVSPDSTHDLGALLAIVAHAPIPHEIEISPPEGFAYYALHPLAYAEVLEKIPLHCATIAVIGIRTIGATLSAVTAAAARARGLHAQRITLRPGGHPYNRHTEFSPEQLLFVRRLIDNKADFVVVDEGPGLSGSSFLSVAEALVRDGVEEANITLICGHESDFNSLRTDDGPRRARHFRWVTVSSVPRKPGGAELFIGNGQWRSHLLGDATVWPASWISLERLKYLSADHSPRRLFKFLGLGHYGERAREREEQVAAAGFGVFPERENDGFASYPLIAERYIGRVTAGQAAGGSAGRVVDGATRSVPVGQPMSASDLTEDVLRQLAAYCAFRTQTFAAQLADLNSLREMTNHNAHEMGIGVQTGLELKHPVIADGRMQPHEWLRTAEGKMLKVDCGSHGDDHFFPGPTDIAWDLAGAIVEWRMSCAQARFFLEAYRRASRDDASRRVDDFVVAYTLHRRAYCLMAANALQGSEEQERLERAAAGYIVPATVMVST